MPDRGRYIGRTGPEGRVRRGLSDASVARARTPRRQVAARLIGDRYVGQTRPDTRLRRDASDSSVGGVSVGNAMYRAD